MFDFWQDVPLSSLNRHLASLFGRTPRWIKSGLDHTVFTAGGGVGVVGMSFFMTDNQQFTVDTTYNMGWQAGAGFGYQLTEAVTLNLAYRYFDYGSGEGRLIDSAATDVGSLSVTQSSHEFRGGIRVNVYGFRNPWR
jgi:opacity protein-like surface antigen